MDRTYLVGIDIGGTFTDFVMCHAPSGRVWLNKRLTTPHDPASCVREGLAEVMAEAKIDGAQLDVAIHGTTLITNALIERKGARTALLATDGHRDVIEIGTEMRYDSYDMFLEKPEPLVPPSLRFNVPERLAPDGAVVRPLDQAAVAAIAASLREADVQSIAVCFLHAFVNPAHERRTREILAEALPGVTVSLSSEVAPEIREYQRLSTTAANAYVQPIAVQYVRRLHADLAATGYARPLYMMLSNGGIVTHEAAAQFPIRMVESGPAAGAMATATLGRGLSRGDLLAFDMGGTTAKACLIHDGVPTTSNECEVARVKRFIKGSGLPLQVPVIELIEIGAGGGSIARVDEMGLLKVGPQSAGSVPGPVCYDRGGTESTVTDADLLLGYLDPRFFLGGKMRLHEEGARAAVSRLGETLGLDLTQTASGIFSVVNTNMISAAKMHMAERGRDPRRYAVVAFGGMGPMHAHAVAAGLKITEVICPASAGVLSAWGMLVAPPAFELARSFLSPLDERSLAHAGKLFDQMAGEGEQMLLQAGVPRAAIRYQRSLDMRYAGQTRELTVSLPDSLAGATPESVRDIFMERYREFFGHAHADVPAELVTCRLVATSPARTVPNQTRTVARGEAKKGQRQAFFSGRYMPATVYDRYRLEPGTTFDGPAMVEERESTVVVPPDAVVTVDRDLNLAIRLSGG